MCNEVRHILLTNINGTFKIMGVISVVIWQNKNYKYYKMEMVIT